MKRSPPPGTPLWLRLSTTFFLVGEAAPFAPATWASFLFIPFLYPFLGWPVWVQLVLTAVVMLVAIPLSTRAESFYGHDASAIVIDEVVGMMVTFLFLPFPGDAKERWLVLLAGFVAFRIFDILKPFPAGRAQNLPGGRGVVLDDVAAGVYANLAVRVTFGFLW